MGPRIRRTSNLSCDVWDFLRSNGLIFSLLSYGQQNAEIEHFDNIVRCTHGRSSIASQPQCQYHGLSPYRRFNRDILAYTGVVPPHDGRLSDVFQLVSCAFEPFTSPEQAVLVGNYTITLFVQSFYIHRVWIISGRNKLVTGLICVAAFFQIREYGLSSSVYTVLNTAVFGLLCTGTVLNARDWQVMFNDPAYPALAAGSSSVCDALITISVAYFLRTKRLQMRRQENYIRQLKIVFMEMGLMSCRQSIMSVLVVVTLMFQDPRARQYWVGAPGPILIKTYFNSMLAMLNARKVIRERQVEAGGLMYDLATIRNTILDCSILLNEN
ncbi:hypothetical protein AZE42_11950 [Rhizopogon vesiculosus]|uniref:DUF6534 domain-containing protein n=1 Tax=Rhizopogon vesiculosus TaxID=180088 RepID=A0A1J8PQN4_9AGAM|nr:hypothetical protein AZE42_11950 [Rhizopogon vesiculosus]